MVMTTVERNRFLTNKNGNKPWEDPAVEKNLTAAIGTDVIITTLTMSKRIEWVIEGKLLNVDIKSNRLTVKTKQGNELPLKFRGASKDITRISTENGNILYENLHLIGENISPLLRKVPTVTTSLPSAEQGKGNIGKEGKPTNGSISWDEFRKAENARIEEESGVRVMERKRI